MNSIIDPTATLVRLLGLKLKPVAPTAIVCVGMVEGAAWTPPGATVGVYVDVGDVVDVVCVARMASAPSVSGKASACTMPAMARPVIMRASGDSLMMGCEENSKTR